MSREASNLENGEKITNEKALEKAVHAFDVQSTVTSVNSNEMHHVYIFQ